MEPYVYKTICITMYVEAPEKYKKLVDFCIENDIYLPPIADDTFTPIFHDDKPRLVSTAFKDLCGAESLRSDGKIRPSSAYNFLLHEMQMKRLIRMDGSIDLNEELQQLFRIERRRMYIYEIPAFIERIFA